MHEDEHHQEHRLARHEVSRPGHQEAPDVEVQAAEVGAQATGAAQPVGLRHVGIEGRKEQVDADADRPRLGPPGATTDRVPELVDQRPRDEQPQKEQQERGRCQDLAEGGHRVAVSEHHHVDDDEASERRHDDRPPVEERQGPSEGAYDRGRHQSAFEPQAQQRVRLLNTRVVRNARCGVTQQPHRLELATGQVLQDLRRQATPRCGTHRGCQLRCRAGGLSFSQHEVEQLGHLHHLPVTTFDEVGRLLETRPSDLTVGLDPRDEAPHRPGGWGRCGVGHRRSGVGRHACIRQPAVRTSECTSTEGAPCSAASCCCSRAAKPSRVSRTLLGAALGAACRAAAPAGEPPCCRAVLISWRTWLTQVPGPWRQLRALCPQDHELVCGGAGRAVGARRVERHGPVRDD